MARGARPEDCGMSYRAKCAARRERTRGGKVGRAQRLLAEALKRGLPRLVEALKPAFARDKLRDFNREYYAGMPFYAMVKKQRLG